MIRFVIAPGLPVADDALVELHRRDDFGRGAGEETFVRGVKVVPR